MVVQHNLTAINANRYLGINNSKLSKSLEKLSSGYQINRAGDNAAGLAVSEKMRSQIAGMKQGVKNAQDGISMVQTFEGALTETHSILQRMKTLADQMANGTYDDPVDRTAAQQEFLQLNDELNQIADTDFNGVVVLNGGKMADGAVADKNGLIDYTNQPARAAKELSASNVEGVNYTSYKVDRTTAADEAKGADALWYNLGLSDDVESVDLTLKYDGTSKSWAIVDSDNYTAKTNAPNNLTVNSVNGGFTILTTETGTAKNLTYDGQTAITGTAANQLTAAVVIDTHDVVDGDTITLNFRRPQQSNSAAELLTFDTNSTVEDINGNATSIAKITSSVNYSAGNTGYETETATTDDGSTVSYAAGGPIKMTAEAKALFDNLNGAEVTFDYKTGSTEGATASGVTLKIGDASISLAEAAGEGAQTGYLNVTTDSGDTITYKVGYGANGGADNAATGRLTISDEKDNVLATLVSGAVATDGKGTATTAKSSVSYKIASATAKYSDIGERTVSVKGKDAYAVSKSDAFKNSEAKLTYKDSIALQAGARTKDLVNFTFQYNSDAIGDLKADLNCTAEGLGTSKLSIATQDSANYAVDKIDQAINKVSLIRGTFGAIQNRLEHKIDNMNVSIENLTSAESQIRDTDMPTEMMEFTKNQILAQAAQSMLAQANQLPQGVLSLLQ